MTLIETAKTEWIILSIASIVTAIGGFCFSYFSPCQEFDTLALLYCCIFATIPAYLLGTVAFWFYQTTSLIKNIMAVIYCAAIVIYSAIVIYALYFSC